MKPRISIGIINLQNSLQYGDILTKSDPTVVFTFMVSYTVATITLCFFISTLFSRANVAAAAGGIIFFCFYLPYSFMVVWEETLSANFKIFSVRNVSPDFMHSKELQTELKAT